MIRLVWNDFKDGLANRLKVYGTPASDLFPFRPGVVAAPKADQPDVVERVNYNSTIDEMSVYGGPGNDTSVLDDTSSILTLYGESGNDTFQIGQLFESPRHPADLLPGTDPSLFNAGLQLEDRIRTTLTTRVTSAMATAIPRRSTAAWARTRSRFTTTRLTCSSMGKRMMTRSPCGRS
jgi:hypothetical protein